MVSRRSSASKGHKATVFFLDMLVGIEFYQGRILDAAVADALN